MDVTQLLATMKRERACGVVRFAIRDRPNQATTEGAVFAVAHESFEAAEVSLAEFRTGLVEIDAGLAGAVLVSLMRFDMAYSGPLMSIERAQELVALYLSGFQSDARYYSNSAWNKNKFLNPSHSFLFGLSAWTSFSKATFDSGIIVYDQKYIGIAWFEDED